MMPVRGKNIILKYKKKKECVFKWNYEYFLLFSKKNEYYFHEHVKQRTET
jgi:hypothetical protein